MLGYFPRTSRAILLMITPDFLIFNFFALLIGAAVQGITGFGFGVITVSLMVILYPARTMLPIITCLALVNIGMLLIHLRPWVDWRKAAWLIVGCVVGQVPGVLILAYMPDLLLRRLIGVCVLLLSLQGLLKYQPKIRRTSRKTALGAGILSGIMGISTNMAGPPVAFYVTYQDWHKDAMRATMQLTFFVNVLLRLPIYLEMKIFTLESVPAILTGLPAVLVGTYLGANCCRKINQDQFLRIVYLLLFLVGILLVFRT